jgi:hypothetical protein
MRNAQQFLQGEIFPIIPSAPIKHCSGLRLIYSRTVVTLRWNIFKGNYCMIMHGGYPPGSGADNTSLRNFVTRVKIDAAVTRAVELEDRFGGSMIDSIPLMKPLSIQNRATPKRGSTITKLKGDIYGCEGACC